MHRMKSSDSATLIFLLAALLRFANGMHCIILHSGPASREAKCKRQNFASYGTAWKHDSFVLWRVANDVGSTEQHASVCLNCRGKRQ